MRMRPFQSPSLLGMLLILALTYGIGFELGEAATGSLWAGVGCALLLSFLVVLAVALVSARRSGPPVSKG